MMVPRSYHYQRRLSGSAQYDEKAKMAPQKPKIQNIMTMSKKKDAARDGQRTPTPPATPTTASTTTADVTTKGQPTVEATEQSVHSEPVHSKPVVIPQPSAHHHRNNGMAQTMRTRGHHGSRHHSGLSKDHKQDAVPPAVAALLAVTAIPLRPTNAKRRRGPQTDRKISIDELLEEWRRDDKDLSPAARYGSPLDILLESPDDCTNDDSSSITEPGSMRENDQEQDMVSIRSLSSESLQDMPSLEADERSSLSGGYESGPSPWTSSPITPSYSRSSNKKIISSPPKEDCILDHPLLHFSLDGCTDTDDEPRIVLTPSTRSPPPKAKSSFKSNLTASLQALKLAAKSFSNFTAPSIPPDDLLTRSLLSPRFTSEMRPKQFQGLPAPALRRYLNPQRPPPLPTASSPTSPPVASPLSPTEFFHDTFAPGPTKPMPMIQLQTYSKSRRALLAGPRRARNDPLTEAGRILQQAGNAAATIMRQREPRENADFLRVIVLEMNMRREGKLDAKALGRARIWLPPRRMEAVEVWESGGAAGGVKVPPRWVGVGVDEV